VKIKTKSAARLLFEVFWGQSSQSNATVEKSGEGHACYS